jgi:hypothetical protein
MSASESRRTVSTFKILAAGLCLSNTAIAQEYIGTWAEDLAFCDNPANAGDGTDAVAVVLEQRRYFGFESVCRFVSVSQRASHEWHVEWICKGEGQTHHERVTLRTAGNQLTIEGSDGAGNTLFRCPAQK